jgi:amidase
MADLWRLSAIDLARRIATKEISCVDVIEAHLERIEAVNPRINAVVKVLAGEARKDAIAADRMVASGATLGPLHGVPFTIKENIDMAGLPTTWGVPGLAAAVPPLDAPIGCPMPVTYPPRTDS